MFSYEHSVGSGLVGGKVMAHNLSCAVSYTPRGLAPLHMEVREGTQQRRIKVRDLLMGITILIFKYGGYPGWSGLSKPLINKEESRIAMTGGPGR